MSLYNLGLSLHLSYGATKTTEGNQEKLIDEDPTKYRRLVEAYVNETMRPLDPLGIHDGEITYVKQVLKYEFYKRQNVIEIITILFLSSLDLIVQSITQGLEVLVYEM